MAMGPSRRFIQAMAFRRGVLGSSRLWFTVWASLGIARFVRTRLFKDEVVVQRYKLKRGQTIQIRDTGMAWEAVEV
jgi:hypothetical protein